MTISKKIFKARELVPVELTAKERLFVQEYADRIGKTHAKRDAGLAAGLSPSGNKNAARVRAAELLDPEKRPDIQEAITAYTLGQFSGLTAHLPDKALELLNCGDRKIEIKMFELIAERGWGSIVRRTANLNHEVTAPVEDILDQLDMEATQTEANDVKEQIDDIDYEIVEQDDPGKEALRARMADAVKFYEEDED